MLQFFCIGFFSSLHTRQKSWVSISAWSPKPEEKTTNPPNSFNSSNLTCSDVSSLSFPLISLLPFLRLILAQLSIVMGKALILLLQGVCIWKQVSELVIISPWISVVPIKLYFIFYSCALSVCFWLLFAASNYSVTVCGYFAGLSIMLSTHVGSIQLLDNLWKGYLLLL